MKMGTSGALLLLTTALTGGALMLPIQAASAQSETQKQFAIPAQPLGTALLAFSRQAGVELFVDDAMVNGKAAPALNGSFTPSQALSRLLDGSGLTYRFNGSGAITLEQAPQAPAGAVQLGTLRVEGTSGEGGGAGGGSGRGVVDVLGDGDYIASVYRGSGTSAYISQDQIQRFRGSSVGDAISGIAGVFNGENRNSGALDINIRGMQGQGRVPIVIDGAMQESTVYRGYAGMAGRTYLDPDLVGGIVIEKGPSAAADASGATGGVARVRTINAGDLIAPDGNFGIVVRAGLTGNNRKGPEPVTVGGKELAVRDFNRPAFLDLQGTNASIAAAYRTDLFDVVAAVTHRKGGNYYAGGNGLDPLAWKGGRNSVKKEEQVVNTSYDNDSYLLRGVLRPAEGHTLDLSYMRYNSQHGEMKPSQFMYGTALYQTESEISVDTYTGRYRFNPSTSLIDFRADVWRTVIDSLTIDPSRIGTFYNNDSFSATKSDRWGVTLSNVSRLAGKMGEFSLAYGFAYDHEKFGKSDDWAELNDLYPGRSSTLQREGWRRQYSGFVSGEYKPAPWATLNLATRYLNTVVQDRHVGRSWVQGGLYNRDEVSGWAPIASAVIEPFRGLQFYGRYAEAIRAASPFEGTEGFSGAANPYASLKPEHAHNTEVGINYQAGKLFGATDLFQAKLGWFNNEITNYITLGTERLTAPNGNSTNIDVLTNIPGVTMRGFELSARYDTGWMFAEFTGTEYTDITSCSRGAPGMSEFCVDGMPRTNQSWFVYHIPPKRAFYVTVGARALDERLSLGVRYSNVQRDPAYQLFDVFGSFHVNNRTSIDFTVSNIGDVYYVDPLTLGEGVGLLPAPGRTFRIGLVSRLGNGSWDRRTSASDRDSLMAAGLQASPWEDFDGDWGGFYAGANMGAAFYRSKGETTSGNGQPSVVAQSERTDRKTEHARGGLQFGYNHQTPGNWVIGFEVDGSLSAAKGRQYFGAPELAGGRFGWQETLQAEYRYSYNWDASARLRFGKAIDRFLVYGTTGLAMLHEKQTRIQSQSNSASASFPFGSVTRPYFTEYAEKTRAGLSFGGGAEVAVSNRISLRGEYIYNRFPDTNFYFPRASQNINRGYTSGGVTVPSAADTPIGRNAANSLDMHSVRVGLNYRF